MTQDDTFLLCLVIVCLYLLACSRSLQKIQERQIAPETLHAPHSHTENQHLTFWPVFFQIITALYCQVALSKDLSIILRYLFGFCCFSSFLVQNSCLHLKKKNLHLSLKKATSVCSGSLDGVEYSLRGRKGDHEDECTTD